MATKSFQDLIVWQKAHRYVLSLYQLTKTFPRSEMFALTSQMRRAAISIPANIVEGFKKRGYNDKLRFLNIAQGSLEESQYFLILSNDLGYGHVEDLQSRLSEVSRLLEAYIQGIERNRRSKSSPRS